MVDKLPGETNEKHQGLVRKVLEFFFPQLIVNRLFVSPYVELGDGQIIQPFRWVRYPLTSEQTKWLSKCGGEYLLRWIIVWLFVVYGSVQIGPPYGAFLFLIFTAFAGWTLIGLSVAVSQGKKTRRVPKQKG